MALKVKGLIQHCEELKAGRLWEESLLCMCVCVLWEFLFPVLMRRRTSATLSMVLLPAVPQQRLRATPRLKAKVSAA